MTTITTDQLFLITQIINANLATKAPTLKPKLRKLDYDINQIATIQLHLPNYKSLSLAHFSYQGNGCWIQKTN